MMAIFRLPLSSPPLRMEALLGGVLSVPYCERALLSVGQSAPQAARLLVRCGGKVALVFPQAIPPVGPSESTP
jgi:hypothetical protein